MRSSNSMRLVGAIVGGGLCACSLLTPLDDLRGGDGGGGGDSSTGAIAYVQGRTVHDSGSKQTSRTTTLVLPGVVAHHTLVVAAVAVQAGTPIDTLTITDDHGDVFTPTSNVVPYDGWFNGVIAGAFDVAGGSTIVSVVATGLAIEATDLFVLEYTGVGGFDVFTTNHGHTLGIDGMTTDLAPTTGSPDLLVALAYTDGTASEGTDFTKRLTATGGTCVIEDRIVPSAGPHGATATVSADGNYWVILMSAFK